MNKVDHLSLPCACSTRIGLKHYSLFLSTSSLHTQGRKSDFNIWSRKKNEVKGFIPINKGLGARGRGGGVQHFTDWFAREFYRFLNNVELVCFLVLRSCNLFLLLDMFWSLAKCLRPCPWPAVSIIWSKSVQGRADKCVSQNIRLYLYVKSTRPSAVREICMALSQMNGSTLYLQCDGFSIFRTDITRDSIRWREMIERCGARGREVGGWGVVVVNISWKNREEGRLIEQVK